MPVYNPISTTVVPRPFWFIALSLAALVMVIMLLAPISRMMASGSINYNEGWNAYHQQTASQGKPLYGEAPKFITNNYPPISFHLVGLASRLTGNVNQTGRWVAFGSLVLLTVLCGAIVHHFTASMPLAIFTAFNAVIWIAFYRADRIGMNDPQLLGMVFSFLGLYLYIRSPDNSGWLVLSALIFAISLLTKHNLLALPAAVGLHLLLKKNWKDVALWGGTIVASSVFLLGLSQWYDGPYFFAHLVAARSMKGWLIRITEYAMTFQLPLVIAVVWALRDGVVTMRHILVLCLLFANVVAFVFAGGIGVDRNIFFDSMFSMVIIGSLVFAVIAPYAARLRQRGLLLGALLFAPSAGVALGIPLILRTDWSSWKLNMVSDHAQESAFVTGVLRSQAGPALCEDLLLCFHAGKALLYEPFFVFNSLKVGRLQESELVALVESRKFRSIQFYLDRNEKGLGPGERAIFSAPFVDAVLRNYRTEARAGNFVVLVPNDAVQPK
jgi:hypothetical protein